MSDARILNGALSINQLLQVENDFLELMHHM